MWKQKLLLIGILGVWLAAGPARASEPMPAAGYLSGSGEIASVDVELGRLQLREERGDYRINHQATRVTDPADKKFLTLEDLRPGQRVAVEFERVGNRGERMARKITVEYTPPEEPAFRETTTTTTTTSTTTTR